MQRPRRLPPRRGAALADPCGVAPHPTHSASLCTCRLRSSAAATLPFGENGGARRNGGGSPGLHKRARSARAEGRG